MITLYHGTDRIVKTRILKVRKTRNQRWLSASRDRAYAAQYGRHIYRFCIPANAIAYESTMIEYSEQYPDQIDFFRALKADGFLAVEELSERNEICIIPGITIHIEAELNETKLR
jgi:hypothetical protein